MRLLLETQCAETPAPTAELPMGCALDVDNRQPRWADELGENDLAVDDEDEPEEGCEEADSVGGGTADTSKGGSAVPEIRGGSGARRIKRQSRDHLPPPGPDLDCELGDSLPPPGLDGQDRDEKGLTPRGRRGLNEETMAAGDKTTEPRLPPAADRASTTAMAAGDRFTFAVRAVILLVRCRGAMLATGTRPMFAWAASAALLRHRCRSFLCERFEQLLSGSAISWPKSLPKAAGGGMATEAANLDGFVLTADDGGQLEAAESAAVRSSTSGAARRKDRRRRLR